MEAGEKQQNTRMTNRRTTPPSHVALRKKRRGGEPETRMRGVEAQTENRWSRGGEQEEDRE